MQVIKLLEIIVVGSIQLLQDKVHLLTSIQINEYKDKKRILRFLFLIEKFTKKGYNVKWRIL